MATDNAIVTMTLQALEDLSAAGAKYHAVAIDDGKLANNGEEASGILINDPASGQDATLVREGESKFSAGAAVTAGDKLTVTTSGWFITATSYSAVVGTAKASVTSGSIGTGIFNFANQVNPGLALLDYDFTAADTFLLGAPVSSGSAVVGAAGRVLGFTTTTVASGAAGKMRVAGIGKVIVGGGTVNTGVFLKSAASGYMVAAASGDSYYAKLLSTTASGQAGDAVIQSGFYSLT